MYRYVWVDRTKDKFFIIIATHRETGRERGKPILVWAVRTPQV